MSFTGAFFMKGPLAYLIQTFKYNLFWLKQYVEPMKCTNNDMFKKNKMIWLHFYTRMVVLYMYIYRKMISIDIVLFYHIKFLTDTFPTDFGS